MILDPRMQKARAVGLRRVAVSTALCALLFGACKIDPKKPKLRFALNQLTTQVDEESGEAIVPKDIQVQIYGALHMHFGQPYEPKFLLTEEWLDEGFNPNYPQYPEDDDGSGDLTEAELDALYTDNEVRFASQLAAIDAGSYADVEVPQTMPDLVRYWQADILDAMTAEDWVDSDEFRDEARALFADWYPTMHDSAELYRVQCLHCHGVSGGGDGPTAEYLKPRPRDYRQGKFKFTAQKDKARPRRADLYRIIEQGATGTAMPSFLRLSKAEIQGLVDYVKLLSIRGETEIYMTTLAEEEDWILTSEMITEAYSEIWSRWRDVDGSMLAWDGEIPEATPAMIEHGRQLYNDATKGNCASCHGEDGRGMGPAVYVFETDPDTGEQVLDPDGNPIQVRLADGTPASAYEDEWGYQILPRNLVRGVYRGSGRPIDIYRRIYNGINGTPMPALGGAVPDEDIWAMVHYVRTLSERPLHHDEHADAGH